MGRAGPVVLDGELAPGACRVPMVSHVQFNKVFLRPVFSALPPDPVCLVPVLLLMHTAPLSSSHTQCTFPQPLSPPLEPMPTLRLQTHLPEVSAACCLTAALSRLKALSAGPSRPFAPTPEVQRRAAALRKAGSADEARVAVRRPSIVSFVLRVVVGVESGARVCCWELFECWTFARLLLRGAGRSA